MANYRGCKEIKYIDNGIYSDPELEWEGYTFNYWEIEDTLWSMFLDETGHKDSESGDPEAEEEFDKYVQENAVPLLENMVIEYNDTDSINVVDNYDLNEEFDDFDKRWDEKFGNSDEPLILPTKEALKLLKEMEDFE